MRKTTVNKRTGAGIVGRRGSRRRSSRGGFTLIELVVVIGIILLLLGLTLSVGVAVRTQSETRETENVLRLLDTAMQEWERQADRQLTWWQEVWPGDKDYLIKDRFDIHSDTVEELIITEMLDVITRPSQIKQIIAQIAPDFIYTYLEGVVPPWIEGQGVLQLPNFLGSVTVLDAWGWPIYATHPGRLWRETDVPPYAFPRNDDGTIQTYNERTYGVTPNRQVIFVSAGPDGRFGDMSQADGSPDFDLTKDNLYSYPVRPPQ
ncbi:MAG: prepilin-type N-terminal cleavage/methylation domain-containing protein [Planctomycetes bacterium]|nr:prepilin-type N-terminal cleavage/methylation domain-containing protein [Planctomycetota bacterium]